MLVWSLCLAGRAAARGHGSIPADASLLQTLFILGPQIFLIDTQKVQVVPREDTAVVAIAERRLYAVIAHRLQAEYADMALASLQHFLTGSVALHFGRRTQYPQ